MRVLLDTCVVIDLLRGDAGARAFQAGLGQRPMLSAMTVLELYAGVGSRREETEIEALIAASDVIRIDTTIARRAGQYRRHFGRSHGTDVADAVIAASAEETGARLATVNVRHFPMFTRLKRAY